MTREDAKQEAQGRLEEYLRDRHYIDTSKKFTCLDPTHPDTHPSMIIRRDTPGHPRAYCQSQGHSYDIFDIVAQDYNLTDKKEIFNKTYEVLNIEIDRPEDQGKSGQGNQKEDKMKQNEKAAASDQVGIKDFTGFYLKAAKDIEKTDYHRGITLETLKRFHVGYVEDWKHPNNPKSPTSPRLIIPITKYSYIARDTRKILTETQEGYKKLKVKGKEGPTWLFNYEAIEKATKPIIVVEGEIDALSIIDAGGEAVAIGSTAYINKFIELVKKHRPQQAIILSLDNDQKEDGSNPGQETEEELAAALEDMGIYFRRYNVAGKYKDANEFLMNDREGFIETVAKAESITQLEKEEEERKKLEEERQEYLKTSTAYKLQGFINEIEKSKEATYFPTGFPSIDNLLDGGLYAGLYTIGAISSLGKTTFCLQIMDNIAASGQDIIIISLEMARAELLAKSISRHTLKEDIKQFETTKHAKTTRGILTGARYANYSQQERAIIEAAIRSYGEYAEHIYIHEGMGDIGINEIREIVKNHIRLTGRKPVILIDYVQILAPYNIKATDKQNTDKAVLEMKRISRDFSIPVIGISSFNRDNYTEPVNMAAFKESGAVEYSSDVLLALQYEGMDYVKGEKKEDRGKRIRDLLEDQANKGRSGQAQSIQVKVLKHRNGSKGSTAVDFYPMFNFFCEKGKSGIEKEDAGEWKEVKAGEKTAKKPAKKKYPSQDGFTPLEFEEPQENKTEETIKAGKERLKKSID